MSALEWAIGDDDSDDSYRCCRICPNEFDWQDALEDYMEGKKEEAYLCLGHVAHLVQDMTVPPHVTPGRVSLLDSDNAMLGYPHGNFWPFFTKGYEYWVGEYGEHLINRANSVHQGSYTDDWRSVLKDLFDLAAEKAQGEALNYRGIRDDGGVNEDLLDIYHLEFDKWVWNVREGRREMAGIAYRDLCRSLIEKAVTYTGRLFTYFYDFVSSPPYVKKVEILQNGETKYKAYWKSDNGRYGVESREWVREKDEFLGPGKAIFRITFAANNMPGGDTPPILEEGIKYSSRDKQSTPFSLIPNS